MPNYRTLSLRGHLKSTQVTPFDSTAGRPEDGLWGFEHADSARDKHAHELAPLLAVYQKQLLRGRRVTIDPQTAAYIAERPHLREGVQSLGQASLAPEIYAFDSDLEASFIKSLGQDSPPLDQYLCPQFPLGGLVAGDTETGERTDFLITDENGQAQVIELDGPGYHDGSTRKKDYSRTRRLEQAGVAEVRLVPGEGLNREAERLRQQLKSLPRRPQSPEQLAHALDCALYLALRHGVLRFGAPEWSIQVLPGAATQEVVEFLRESAQGALRHLGALATLYGQQLPPHIKVSLLESATAKEPEGALTVSFGRFAAALDRPGCYCYRELPSVSGLTIALRPIPAQHTVVTPDRTSCLYLLRLLFGHQEFNDGQFEALRRVLRGEDAIVLLPTGGGKSAIYQLAGMLLPGTTLVIAPAMALINDQVRGLAQDSGIERAVGFTSEMGQVERLRGIDSLVRGQLAFALATPQRLLIPEFQDALEKLKATTPLPLVVMDEAHCVSEWGHEFVTEYLGVGDRARALCRSDARSPALLALTGTATESVLRDVRRELGIEAAESVITPTSFDRPEIQYGAMLIPKVERAGRLAEIVSQVRRKAGGEVAGIVFCPHVNGDLGILNIKSIVGTKVSPEQIALFSGGAPKGMEKDAHQTMKAADFAAFMAGTKSLMIATKAFGMGINHKRIRFTIHIATPGSIESLYQESGRAGRDKTPGALALFLTDPADEAIHQFFLGNAFPGIPKELESFEGVLKDCGNLERPYEGSVPVTSDEAEKKVIHRLKLLGLITDYRIRYATTPPLIEFERVAYKPERAAEGLLRYVASFEKGLAEGVKRRLPPRTSPAEHLEAIYKLLCEFIYERIRGGREQALREVLALLKRGAALKGKEADREIRTRILHYLEGGSGFEHFERLKDEPADPKAFAVMLEMLALGSLPASRLRGRTARLLESHPDNPAFRVLRAIAELAIEDGDSRLAADLIERCLKETPEKYGLDNTALAHMYASYVERVAERQPGELAEAFQVMKLSGVLGQLMPILLSSSVPLLQAEALAVAVTNAAARAAHIAGIFQEKS